MPHKLNGKIEIVGAVQKGYIKCHFEASTYAFNDRK